MNESDWIVLRLVRKMVRQDARASLDTDVFKAMGYLRDRYGSVHLHECAHALVMEKRSQHE